MNSSYEPKLSTAALMQRNQFTPPASAETAGESGSGTQNSGKPTSYNFTLNMKELHPTQEEFNSLLNFQYNIEDSMSQTKEALSGLRSTLPTKEQASRMDTQLKQLAENSNAMLTLLKEMNERQIQAGKPKGLHLWLIWFRERSLPLKIILGIVLLSATAFWLSVLYLGVSAVCQMTTQLIGLA